MTIELRKFGLTLTSRPQGLEALKAIRPSLDPDAEEIIIDFDGIFAVSPSWADEFLYGLLEAYGDRLRLLPSENPSVLATLRTLNVAHPGEFERFLK